MLKNLTRTHWYIALPLLGILALLLLGPALDVRAQDDGGNLYLPLVTRQKPMAVRIGYGVTSTRDNPADLEGYEELPSLRAGWYLNWNSQPNPQRPDGIQYAQMIRLHQTKSCGERYHDYDGREDCPLLDSYTTVSSARLAQIAASNPGALYLIGNEMERVDWGPNDGQDEISPELYAVAYHDLYEQIKALDPTAKVAIGGVVQVTELRLQWLQIVWDSYKARYGTPMPVDVWNAHFFAIREVSDSWGADIPSGLIDPARRFGPVEDRQSGEYTEFADRAKHGDVEELKRQAYRFREFMANLEPSQKEKPLVISEYGLLYNNVTICQAYREVSGERGNCSISESGRAPDEPKLKWHETNEETPAAYMIDSFNFFLNEKNCDVGYTADDCRLVQKWNWYSLDDKNGNFNEYNKLIDPNTGEITNTGRAFRDWVNANFDELTHIGGW